MILVVSSKLVFYDSILHLIAVAAREGISLELKYRF